MFSGSAINCSQRGVVISYVRIGSHCRKQLGVLSPKLTISQCFFVSSRFFLLPEGQQGALFYLQSKTAFQTTEGPLSSSPSNMARTKLELLVSLL